MRCLPYAACAVVLLTLAACGGVRQQAAAPVVFPQAPLPMYSAGDSYTFDDGSVFAVTGTANGAVQWRNAGGARFVTTRDVLLPPIAWADSAQRGRRRFSTPDALFPLQPGSGASFIAALAEQPNGGGPDMGGQENWQCQVGEAQRIHVPVGWFETVRADCAVTKLPGGRYEQRSFFYAPAIGYYVRRVDRVGDAPPRTVQLIAWTDGNPPLPESSLRQRVAAIQRALEGQPGGAVVNWQDPVAQAAGWVEPTRNTSSDDGRVCRDFQEHVEAFGRRYAMAGAACRETAGGWQVVSLAPG